MKIGILATAYEVPRVESLLRYLGRAVEVRVHVDEETLIDGRMEFAEQALFTKGRGYGLLTMARIAEAAGIPVVNSAGSTWIAMHRMMASIVCRKAGVPVPEFALAMSVPQAFEQAIVKNVIDQHHLRFLDRLPIVAGPQASLPPIETAEEAGVSELAPRYHYCQRFVHSEYEYKVYGIGDRLLFYRQQPVLVNPDKMATRVQIDGIPALASAARAALRATGLAIASLDFLEEDGTFYLTDVNCTPNFNHVEGGAALVGDYLLACASRS
jgi:glutathione synthase/RimK-type ligase-like ATP-grasp enzyme